MTVRVFSLDRRKYRVCNWLIVLARKSVYDSRSNKFRCELPDGVLYILKARVKHRLTIEFQHAQFIGEIDKFKFDWCISRENCDMTIKYIDKPKPLLPSTL